MQQVSNFVYGQILFSSNLFEKTIEYQPVNVITSQPADTIRRQDGDLALKTVAEAYTSYLDPRECSVRYLPTITRFKGGLSELKDKGYDVAILGSGMFNRYYDSPDSFAREVNMYDEVFEQVPDVMAFENQPNPLEFIRGGSNVYVLFLTERARQFEIEAKLSSID